MNAESWSTLILRANAIILICALPAVIFPFPWMDHVHQILGLGSLPDMPLVQYLARSISALYAICGVGTWLIAADVRRYAPLVRLWYLACLGFGVAILAIDAIIEMPTFWIVIEGPYLIATGLTIGWLHRKIPATEGLNQ